MSGLGSQILVLIFLCLAVVGSQRQVDHQQSPHQQQDHLKDTGPFSHHTGTNTDTSHRDTLKTSDNNNNMKQKPSEAVIQAFETSLLQMFGLKHRPKPKRKDKIHIPEYLMELYRQHTGDPDRTSINFNVKNTDTLSANTIRSFSHIDKEDRDRGRLKHRGKLAQEDSENSHIKHLYFNTSSIPGEETLTAAQLRLFRHNNYSKTDYESLSQFGLQKHRIEIYEVLRPGSSWREPITRLLDTKLVDPKDLSWEELDVKPAVLKWLESPHLNHGLQVHFVTEAGAPSKLQHVRLRRSLDMDDRQWSREQPTLLTFGDDGKTASKVRTKRGARHRKRDRSHLKKRRKDECKRHELYVDFSDVGWDDWIVAPPGYQAYYCHGECSFPLPEYINATNHAIVQTLVHSVDPQAIPRPCCVPTELSPISMLYLDEYEKVVLKNYQDMVVIGCGCR